MKLIFLGSVLGLLTLAGCKKDGNLVFMNDYYAASSMCAKGYTNSDIRIAENSLKEFIAFLEKRQNEHPRECLYATAVADERLARLCEFAGRTNDATLWRHKRDQTAMELGLFVTFNPIHWITNEISTVEPRLNPGWMKSQGQ